MNFILKVPNCEHKSQLLNINLSQSHLVYDLNDPKPNIDKYDNKLVYVEYIGKSRIDGFPMFKIDTLSIDRDDKISQIIN